MKDAAAEIRTELIISEILRWGVRTSLALILLGSVLFLTGAGATKDMHELVSQGGAFPLSIGWMLGGLFRLDGTAIIVLGLAVLIATPVLRVVAALASFALQRDRTYTIISAIVLAFVVFSFLMGEAL